MNLVFLQSSLVAREERKKENRQPRKLNYTFPTETLTWLFSLKEIIPSIDGKMIKLLTFENYFPPLRRSRRFCKSRSRMTKAIAFSRWKRWCNGTLLSTKKILSSKYSLSWNLKVSAANVIKTFRYSNLKWIFSYFGILTVYQAVVLVLWSRQSQFE